MREGEEEDRDIYLYRDQLFFKFLKEEAELEIRELVDYYYYNCVV